MGWSCMQDHPDPFTHWWQLVQLQHGSRTLTSTLLQQPDHRDRSLLRSPLIQLLQSMRIIISQSSHSPPPAASARGWRTAQSVPSSAQQSLCGHRTSVAADIVCECCSKDTDHNCSAWACPGAEQPGTGVVQHDSSCHHCSTPLVPESSEEPSNHYALPACRLESRHAGRLSDVWSDRISQPQA